MVVVIVVVLIILIIIVVIIVIINIIIIYIVHLPVVRPRSCRVIYYCDTPALGIRHQLFNHVNDPNDSECSNYYRQRPVHPSRDDPDERVMRHIKIEAPTFEGQLDRWIFYRWIRDMDQFFGWYNL